MKHAHVADTLIASEIAPWAVMAEASCERIESPARALIAWDGEAWAEIDPVTGDVIATGTIGREVRA